MGRVQIFSLALVNWISENNLIIIPQPHCLRMHSINNTEGLICARDRFWKEGRNERREGEGRREEGRKTMCFCKSGSSQETGALLAIQRKFTTGVTTELHCQKANNEVIATAKTQKLPLVPRTGKTKAREDVLKPRLLPLLSRFSRVRLCATPETAAHQAPVSGILQARTLEWVAISFSNVWKWSCSVISYS